MTYPHPEQENLYDDAMTDEPQHFFGQPSFNLWKCVLVKGQGKVPYDPVTHAGQRTSIAVELTLTPLDAKLKLVQRQMLNWTPDFKGVMRPSIEALAARIAEIKGLQVGQFNPLKEIEGMFTSGEFVPRPDNKPGETWTTLRFDAVYATQEECEAAYQAHLAELGVASSDTPGGTDDGNRARAALFLPALWAQAGGMDAMTDDEKAAATKKLVKLIDANPILAEHFTVDAPEVRAIIDEVQEVPPF